jgi:hypothetical protein
MSKLRLSEQDQAMLAGADGAATQMAMRIIVKMAEFHGARALMNIEQAHIDSTLYMGMASLEFAERLVELGGQVKVPSTVNVSGLDEHGWQEWPVPESWARNAGRQMQAYLKMGCKATWTCAPYQLVQGGVEGGGMVPTFGQHIAWAESNAIAFANSILGARTERYPDLMDICAAITGRVPAVGLHLTENRAATVHLDITAIPERVQQDGTFYPVLGFLMGKIAQDRIPVISGWKVTPAEDELKALAAAGGSAGTVAMFHLVGITPEAPSLQAALQGQEPEEQHHIRLPDLIEAREALTTTANDQLDVVILGSPHFSMAEFGQLAPLVAGHTCHAMVDFLITSSRAMAGLAEKAGYLQPLRDFGGKITLDTCLLTTPMLASEKTQLMTNSAKYAYYSPGLLNAEITFGSLEECVQSAINGKISRDKNAWESVL